MAAAAVGIGDVERFFCLVVLLVGGLRERWLACGCWTFVQSCGGFFGSNDGTLVVFDASVAGRTDSTVTVCMVRRTLATDTAVVVVG